jgi:aminoglycoside phosphotransferase (APT) family kinase protein
MIPRSPTQRALTPGDVRSYVKAALPGACVLSCEEMSGGGYAAVWRATLGDGQDVVLKVGPPARVRQLRYERELMAAEATYYRLVRPLGVPVPEVLHAEQDWLLVSYLPGTPLSLLEGDDFSPVRSQLGSAMARVHALTGEHFGYRGGDRPRGAVWADVFGEMVEDLLADAADWDVTLPLEPQRIRGFLRVGGDALAQVRRPALVHFDLWDGNVLCEGGRLTGLVDGERYLYGDPLIDFVSPAIAQPLEAVPTHPFTRGYEPAVEWDDAALTRLALYRMHLFLLMAVEGPSRGMGPELQAQRAGWLLSQSAEIRR